MPRIQFNGDFYSSKSKLANAQRTVNWYTESDPTGKNKLVAYPTPGTVLKITVGNGPIRGMHVLGNKLYVVSDDELYEITTSFSATLLGSISSGAGTPVSMTDNGKNAPGQELFIVDGNQGYVYNTFTSTFYTISSVFSGTTTSYSADTELNNSSATFVTWGVQVGQKVVNDTDGTEAYVTVVDSETRLTVDTGIFPTPSGDAYHLGDADFPDGATTTVFFDGLFIVNDASGTVSGQTGAFMWSDSYTGRDWQALNFATAERNPDDLIAVTAINKIIYLFGERTTELWYNASGSDAVNPFKPQTTIGVGIKATHTVARTGDSLLWLSTDDKGHARVTIATGTRTKAVSTYALENEWNSYSDLTDAYAFIYEQDGHTFYELTFPTGDRTFVYDILQNSWHERESYNGGSGGKHKVRHSAFFSGLTLVGDDTSGKIYSYDTSVYLDNTDPIVRQRDTQHIATDDDVSVRHKKVVLEFESGVGTADVSSTATSTQAGSLLDSGAPFVVGDVGKAIYNTTDNTSTTISGYTSTSEVDLTDDIMVSGEAYVMGLDPQVELYWSDDRGYTWKGPLYRTLGLAGDNVKKVSFPNIGMSKDRIYRVKGSDNANYTLVGAFVDVAGGVDES